MVAAGSLDLGISAPTRENSVGTVAQSILPLAGVAGRRGSDV